MAEPRPRRGLRRAAAALLAVGLAVGLIAGGGLLLVHPATPLPPQWNPLAPLSIGHPVTPLTRFKLWRALSDGGRCRAALAGTGAAATPMPDLRHEGDSRCGIPNRVALSRVGDAALRPVETRCEVALRFAYWERHGLSPAARAVFGEGIARIEHQSSYNCRAMRTGRDQAEDAERLSLHATAEAIDVTGVVLESGRRVRLVEGWSGAGDEAAFLRAARDSACRWFATVLGPDYNRLHADHFHLQSRGWGLCR